MENIEQDSGASSKRLILLSTAIILSFLITLAGLDWFGRGSRVIAESYGAGDAGLKGVIVNMPLETYGIWKEKGFSGRTVVNLSARFNFESVKEMDSVPDTDFPLKTYNVSKAMEKELTSRNFLVVAIRNNLVRKIMHVVTPSSYGKALKSLENRQGISVNKGVIEVPFFASPRSIRNLDSLTSIGESVLLFVDASIFREHTAKEVFERLKSAGLKTDFAVLSLSAEDPDVTERERAEMKVFAVLLGVK